MWIGWTLVDTVEGAVATWSSLRAWCLTLPGRYRSLYRTIEENIFAIRGRIEKISTISGSTDIYSRRSWEELSVIPSVRLSPVQSYPIQLSPFSRYHHSP